VKSAASACTWRIRTCPHSWPPKASRRTFVKAGEFKTEGNSYQPLDEAAQAFLQTRVDAYYAVFTKADAKGLNVGIDSVRNGMGQGRCLGADAALAAKMVDGIATFDQVIKNMQKQAKAPRLASAQSHLAILQAKAKYSQLARAKRELDILR